MKFSGPTGRFGISSRYHGFKGWENVVTYYVKTQVELKYGQDAGFNEVLSALVPFLGRHGWKLTCGLQALVGSPTERVHIWEVEDIDDIPVARAAATTDAALGKQVARLPDFMNAETMAIMVKTPYSP
jgi:hypothetical protein